jgi:hypothetical protein
MAERRSEGRDSGAGRLSSLPRSPVRRASDVQFSTRRPLATLVTISAAVAVVLEAIDAIAIDVELRFRVAMRHLHVASLPRRQP